MKVIKRFRILRFMPIFALLMGCASALVGPTERTKIAFHKPNGTSGERVIVLQDCVESARREASLKTGAICIVSAVPEWEDGNEVGYRFYYAGGDMLKGFKGGRAKLNS